MKSVNFWWHCFLLVKKITFYAKSVSFLANEWISKFSDEIMSRKLWGKVTSVSVNINFGAKVSILCEKHWNFGRNVDFFIECALLRLPYCKICLFLEKCDFLCEGLYTSIKCQILIRIFNFFGYDNLYMCYFSLKYFICRKVVILIQNIILCNDILGKCHFPSNFYIAHGINSWEKLSNFLRMVLI